MSSPTPSRHRFLDDRTAQALDRLCGETSANRGTCQADERLTGLLALLNPSEREAGEAARRRTALVGTVCARATAQESTGVAGAIAPARSAPALTESSKALTDAFIINGTRSPATALLSLLDTDLGVEARREAVVERTLTAVQRDIERQSQRLRMSSAADLGVSRSRFNLRDMIASAAAVMIGLAVVWPSANALRATARQELCASNLQQAGMGMGMFAAAQDNELPSVEDRAERPIWWRVGEPRHSHSANIFRLVSGGYATMHALSCPCNACAPQHQTAQYSTDWRAPEEVSYSYLLFESAAPPRMDAPTLKLLLVDRSPVVERARLGETFQINTNSNQHAGRGQNALLADLSTQFLTSPELGGDNIWVPRSIEITPPPPVGFKLIGNERPADGADIFVGP